MNFKSNPRTGFIALARNGHAPIITLSPKGTIDEVIYKVVNKKADLSTEVLNFLRGNVKHVNQYQTA